MATLMLAEAGAEVIKVERPGTGDEMRAYPPHWGEHGSNFALLNRGKQSITLDLKSPADRDTLRPLLERADVLIEQFRPGVMERLGLSFHAVRALNPDIIYCSITGYGQTGPHRLVAGHDLNYIAEAGLLALSHGSPTQPVIPPALIADIAGGSYPAVMNILLALLARARGVGAQHLDISMSDNLFPFLYWALGQGAVTGRWPGNGTGLVTGGTARYRLYPTGDGGMIAAAPIEDRFWTIFCDAIGLDPALRDDTVDPAATMAGVADRISAESTAFGAPSLRRPIAVAARWHRCRMRSRTLTSSSAAVRPFRDCKRRPPDVGTPAADRSHVPRPAGRSRRPTLAATASCRDERSQP